MTKIDRTDATLAKLLACLPVFQRWSNQPLPTKLHQIIRSADEQTLLGIAVFALRRASQEFADHANQN